MRRRALAGPALAVALAASAAAASSAKAPARVSGLHDARYCEVIELRGAPPTALATVWNTIGLNTCPAAKWNAIDATALAKERGDTLVVKNGPRHFLMDSATATVGAVHDFHGVRATKVATIAIRSAADLVRAPYTDRVITRQNTWSWRKGRTVFELVAPGGDTYVMQSYSQIVDPKMSYGKLAGLARRLTLLPAGWHYRTRRLRRPLTLGANGSATIMQDDLQDTYQLATTAPRGRRASHAVRITGHTRSVHPVTPGTVEDHGTLTGTPFGKGTIVLVGKLANGRLTATYRLLFAHGSVRGAVTMPFTISGGNISFHGTSRLTGGTGAYRGVTSGALTVDDHNTLNGQHGVLTVKGRATFGARVAR